jgi:hypothetical protein
VAVTTTLAGSVGFRSRFRSATKRRADHARGRVVRRLQHVRGGEIRGPHSDGPVRRSRRREPSFVFGKKRQRRDGVVVQPKRAIGRARRVRIVGIAV